MRGMLLFIGLLLCANLFSQEDDYTKPDSKVRYNGFASFPSTRGFGYNIGMEREKVIRGNTSFVTSMGISAVPVNVGKVSKSCFLGVFIQPFHIMTGSEKWKFESGISVSYLDFNLFNNQNILIKPADRIFYDNLFVGARFCPSKKIALHAGYVPRYILGGNKDFYLKFGHGVELSFFYRIS